MWNLLEGKGSELSVLALFLIFIITLAASCLKWGWPWTWGRGKKRTLDTVRSNPGYKAGESPTCKDNRDKIIAVETKVINIEGDITEIKSENKKDHIRIFGILDKIRNGLRGGG